jgi:hypothetical protein
MINIWLLAMTVIDKCFLQMREQLLFQIQPLEFCFSGVNLEMVDVPVYFSVSSALLDVIKNYFPAVQPIKMRTASVDGGQQFYAIRVASCGSTVVDNVQHFTKKYVLHFSCSLKCDLLIYLIIAFFRQRFLRSHWGYGQSRLFAMAGRLWSME